MSRYSLRPLAHRADLFEVALGWDPGLGTFFVTVFGTPDDESETDVRLWRGTAPREIGTSAELIAIAADYAEIPGDLQRRLEIDRLQSPNTPDRPPGRLMEALLACDRILPTRPNGLQMKDPPMSNCYTHCCFAITITPGEADLLREAIAFAELLEWEPEDDAIVEQWNGLSEAFRTLFVAIDDNPISGFLAIFPDCDYPTFGTRFSFDEESDGGVRVFAHAEQFEPDAVAELLRRTIHQSLPISVTWSFDSDRHQPDAFGGGGFLIDAAGVHWIGTSMVHDKKHFATKYVLTMRDDEEGLLFWNDTDGFGPLEEARVFTEDEAKSAATVIAVTQPEWLELPKGLFG